MKRIAAAVFSLSMLAAQSSQSVRHSVTAVRHWPVGDVTRVAIEVSGNFEFVTDRLHNPERVYYDILNTRLRIEAKRVYSEQIDDKLVTRIRMAETKPGVTRVVLDLTGPVEASASQLSNPKRLIIELRRGAALTLLPEPPATSMAPPALPRLELPASLTKVAAPVRPPAH